MAQKVNIILVDDLDGTEATETVAFGLDGTSYEIDLSEDHAGELRELLAGYVGNARKVAGRRTSARKATSGASGSAAAGAGGASAKEIREWARSQGHEVPERGRIPAEIRDAYEAAS